MEAVVQRRDFLICTCRRVVHHSQFCRLSISSHNRTMGYKELSSSDFNRCSLHYAFFQLFSDPSIILVWQVSLPQLPYKSV